MSVQSQEHDMGECPEARKEWFNMILERPATETTLGVSAMQTSMDSSTNFCESA